MEKKKKVYVTPAGVATFCFLVSPSDKFNKDGVYSVKLALDRADGEKLVESLQPEYDEAVGAAKEKYDKETPQVQKKNPFKENPFYEEELDASCKETGRYLFNFKMTAKGISKKTGKAWERSPMLFDVLGAPIQREKGLNIWSGTVLKVAFTLNPYYVAATGCGISLCLEAAQILKLSNGEKSASAFGFTPEEGFSEDLAESASVEGENDF